jgi:hypothetical protein
MRTGSFVTPTRLCVVKCAEVAAHVLPVGFADIAKLLGIATDMDLIHDVVILGLVNRSTHLGAPVALWHLKSLA